jgi:hypothetical protein
MGVLVRTDSPSVEMPVGAVAPRRYTKLAWRIGKPVLPAGVTLCHPVSPNVAVSSAPSWRAVPPPHSVVLFR